MSVEWRRMNQHGKYSKTYSKEDEKYGDRDSVGKIKLMNLCKNSVLPTGDKRQKIEPVGEAC